MTSKYAALFIRFAFSINDYPRFLCNVIPIWCLLGVSNEMWCIVAVQWTGFLTSMSLSIFSPITSIIVGRYLRFVKPSYDNFVRPTASHADIVRRLGKPCPITDFGLRSFLGTTTKSLSTLYAHMCDGSCKSAAINSGGRWLSLTGTCQVVPARQRSSPIWVWQFIHRRHKCRFVSSSSAPICLFWLYKGIFTIVRSKDSPRRDFIFFVDRLATLLVEYALQHLPYVSHHVVTPVNAEFNGLRTAAKVGDHLFC